MDSKLLIAENLAHVRARIAEAASHSGRTAADIKLVAVTKYVPAEMAQLVVEAGCFDLGENRPQELWSKAAALSSGQYEVPLTRWHLIGHLQRNKIQRTLPLVALIHSGDNLRLLEAINRAAQPLQRRIPVLLEVNISGDATKHGFRPDEIDPALPTIAALQSIEIQGLMAMASREGDPEQARREFAAVRQLRDRLRKLALANIGLDQLSMGMSGDYTVAIEEGATMVRIGSALFEGIGAD